MDILLWDWLLSFGLFVSIFIHLVGAAECVQSHHVRGRWVAHAVWVLENSLETLRDTVQESKNSSVYLLLDPTILYATSLPQTKRGKKERFKKSVFYVGVGALSYNRPLQHLLQALLLGPITRKLQRIIAIWTAKRGVIIVQGYLRVKKMESLFREASIIRYKGCRSLTNEKWGSTKRFTELTGIDVSPQTLSAFGYRCLEELYCASLVFPLVELHRSDVKKCEVLVVDEETYESDSERYFPRDDEPIA